MSSGEAGSGSGGGDGNIKGVLTHGGRYVQYNVYGNLFEVSTKYVPPIRPVGRGAYGIVCLMKKKRWSVGGGESLNRICSAGWLDDAPDCAAVNSETHEEVAIKKIGNAFDNRIDAKRTLREIKLLRHMDHENTKKDRKDLMVAATGETVSAEEDGEKQENALAQMLLHRMSIAIRTVFTGTCIGVFIDKGWFLLSTESAWPNFQIISVPQVISIKDIIRPPKKETFNDVYIVYELMDTDLHQIIRSTQPLTDDHCQYFLYQLLRGLKYVHSAHVLHRDLKPSNLLLNANCDLKIGDFGLARTTSETDFMTEYVVTRWYRAPELLLNCSEYTAAIDVWSVGCILGEIMTREPLFPGKDYVHQLRLITELLGSPDDTSLGFLRSDNARRYVRQLPQYPKQQFATRFSNMSAGAVDLLEKMLVFDPNKRITVDEALCHPYLKSLHDINDEPICPRPFVFDFEQPSCTEENIKELIWRESVKFNPDPVH
ncbi:hypothetical protein Syun_018845 [Stephania yunnanensis]|uniref:Protein kinase domain-containing protein n=1 Tax=Stephania yunnanensis TaxID=152371 RepID=A0AAP0IT07_9MAGN